jgi:hypothetical protein
MILTAKAALPISDRTVFVDMNTIRMARGATTDKIKALVDSGGLMWVFDIGRAPGGSHTRQLRFWLPEVMDAGAVADLTLAAVIDRILPPARQTFNGSELGQWLMVSKPTVQRLGRQLAGTVQNRLWRVERQALATFLAARWIGAQKQ